jgi:hypothetical protein
LIALYTTGSGTRKHCLENISAQLAAQSHLIICGGRERRSALTTEMPESTAFGRSADADRLINLDFSRDTQRPDTSTEGAPLREFSSSVESRRSHERTYSQQSQGGSVVGLRHVAAEHRVGYIAVPLPAGATSSASHAPPMTLSNAEGSPAAAARRPRVTIRSPPQTHDDVPPTCMLPPLRDGYEYQPVHIVTRDIDLPRVIEDPSAYRPATPILNWEGPKRSLKPPKMQFWLCVTFICVVTNVVSGVVPLRLNTLYPTMRTTRATNMIS